MVIDYECQKIADSSNFKLAKFLYFSEYHNLRFAAFPVYYLLGV